MSYSPNPLNEYDTYTYNIALYMVHPNNLSQLDGAISSGIPIANNVVDARYNLTSVEQVFTVGHGQVREAFGSMFQMTVNEPNGVTLLSKIQQAASQLGIQNHTNAGYIIAIEFNGRMPDGSARKHPQVFYFPVMFTRFEFNVTEMGTVYNIEAVESSTLGYNYITAVIRDQIVVEARTVGEFIDEFQRKLQESLLNAWVANPNMGALQDQYSFEFGNGAEGWRDWGFEILEDPFDADGANFIGLPGANPKLQVSINNGSNFTAIIGQVLQLTKEYKKIIAHDGGTFRNQTYEATQKQLDSFPVFHKVLANVEFGQFDPLRNEYQKIVKYVIQPYMVPDELIDNLAYQSSITNPGVQSRRVQNLFGLGLLRKRYDYLFTGQNTEVLEFDMQFNNAYYYATPYGDGYFGEPNTQNPEFATDVPEQIARLEALSQARQQYASAAQNFNAVQGQDVGGGIFNQLRGVLGQAGIDFNNALGDYQSFLSDQFEFSPGKVNHPVRFVHDVVDDGDILTSDNDRRSGVLKFGAVKMNLESAADLLDIEIGIRGDPYWFGAPNSLYNSGGGGGGELANYELGSNSFFLNVHFPTADEDAAGQRVPSPDYQLTALYTVTSVINKFQNGQFTQYLTAHLDNATNTNTAIDTLKGGSGPVGGVTGAGFGNSGRNLAQEQEDASRALGIFSQGGPF